MRSVLRVVVVLIVRRCSPTGDPARPLDPFLLLPEAKKVRFPRSSRSSNLGSDGNALILNLGTIGSE